MCVCGVFVGVWELWGVFVSLVSPFLSWSAIYGKGAQNIHHNHYKKRIQKTRGVLGSFVRRGSSFSPIFILWDFCKKNNYGVKKKLGIFFSHHKLKKEGFSKLPLTFHFSTFIFVDFLFPKSLSNFFTLF
jgi:hypothetical protein